MIKIRKKSKVKIETESDVVVRSYVGSGPYVKDPYRFRNPFTGALPKLNKKKGT